MRHCPRRLGFDASARSPRPPAPWVLLLLLLLAMGPGWLERDLAALAPDPLEPAASGGLVTVERALARLPQHQRVLVVAAHPDDEDTALLALTALALGGEAAYLSLSRGEGGQNLIGTELGEALGVVRTGELMAARRVDGARQYFARAYDFGFTRSLEETLEHWPLEVLLEDTVRVIRRFRPQVVVTIFPPDARAGHGQHQAAGKVTELAFRSAGDPDAFPGLDAEGLPPWQPDLLFRSVWWDPEAATLEVEAGLLDPLTGRSVAQLAMASRSLHRSQSMGMAQHPGPRPVRLALLESRVPGGGEGGLFAGLDTRLEAIADLVSEGEAVTRMAPHLARAAELATAARDELTPTRLGEAMPALAEILSALREARRELAASSPNPGAGAAIHVDALLAEKEELATVALAAAAGVVLDATTGREAVVPGEQVEVALRLWNAGRQTLTLAALEVISPEGWRAAHAVPGAAGREVSSGLLLEEAVQVPVPAEAPVTVPYYLRNPRRGSIYDLEGVPRAWWGEPDGPPPLVARALLTLVTAEGTTAQIEIEREVVYREVDLATGERRRPLRLVPRLEVSLAPGLLVWPLGDPGPRRLEVAVANNGPNEVTGRVDLEAPSGWPSPPSVPFRLGPGERRSLALETPQPLAAGRFTLRARARAEGREVYGARLPVVTYEHIAPRAVPVEAAATVTALPLRLPSIERLGYVRGAADQVPEALAAAGLPVELLAPEDLLELELAAFEAIVIGARAYEWQPDLARANPRLLEYVAGGGHLVVQFQRWEYFEEGLAPLPMEIPRRGAGRTTDPAAPVRLLEPGHPAFSAPNRLGPEDWRGWVQERGLYYPSSWDEGLTPLLALADPGEEEHRGALLVAEVGRGTYVYTGLAFFRQLPAGVPGAYRLFANLLAPAGETAAARAERPQAQPAAPADPGDAGALDGSGEATLDKVVTERWRDEEERLLWWSRFLDALIGRRQ